MNWDISHIWMTEPIKGVTINDVYLSPEFKIVLYGFMTAILFAVTFYFLRKKSSFSEAFKKAVIAAFFASGLLYALHADIGWTQWCVSDIKKNWGLSTEEKLRNMDDGLYEFQLEAKKIIHADYQLFSSDNHVGARLQYYLLPLHKRDNARYIIVIADKDAHLDQSNHILRRGQRIYNVEPVLQFAQDAYILKRP